MQLMAGRECSRQREKQMQKPPDKSFSGVKSCGEVSVSEAE